MTSTPRLRSGYPSTPVTSQRRQLQQQQQQTPSSVGSVSSAGGSSTKSPTLPLAPENAAPAARGGSEPLIPLTLLDAPQQRFYAFGIYVALWAWKLYDWLQVVEDGEGSWILLAKWILIDFAYLFLLPELRIPWLELSQSVVTFIYMGHVVITWMLMFLIPIPLLSWLLAIVKVLYDREISVSEHNVKVSSILNNHSLIMGKQIINILPEGTAVLNPDHTPFCLPEKVKRPVSLPIFFNATVPAEIELIRVDIKTNKEEIIKLSNREVSKLAKIVREQNADPSSDGFRWEYPVKKPGIYRLGKVLDEYKLEVQRSTQDTYVVQCPEARLMAVDDSQRCTQDLSNLRLDVYGTAPLKISYSRTVSGANKSFHFQSLQPNNLQSPLSGSSQQVLALDTTENFEWLGPHSISVAVNETMTASGPWEYSIDQVEDAFGNVVDYVQEAQDPKFKTQGLSQQFAVKERPKVTMRDCSLRSPLRIAKGRSDYLPVSFGLEGKSTDTSHSITWDFSPIDSLTSNGDHGESVSVGKHYAKNSKDRPLVSQPGLYTLKSVSSGSCEGQIQEPSSCLVLNPLEPSLSIRSEEISDKCAGNSIGLLVDLDLVGTPPFDVKYDVYLEDKLVERSTHTARSLRDQIKLIPKNIGQYKYVFTSIDDNVYKGISLTGQDKVLQHYVKPAASATIGSHDRTINACLDSEVETDVYLYGEPPFSLEWEVIHDGKRKTERVANIMEDTYKIKTAPLTKGGEYILALSSVQDVRQCRTFLQEQVKIAVRRSRPRASFGLLEQKRSIKAVENTPIRLPLRLQGEAPWTVRYRNLNHTGMEPIPKTISGANDYILVKSRGIWEIVDVSDNLCPGNVDESASTFEIEWFKRPQLKLIETESIKGGANGVFVKDDVCEGDIDGFEIGFEGTGPYHVEYQVQHKPISGSKSIQGKKFDAALSKAAVSLDTSNPGDYIYKFSGLADSLYDTDSSSNPVIVQQHINAKPKATFTKPGQTFKLCQEEQEHEDTIPIKLTGVAPYYVELEIKHQGGSGIETYSIPEIASNSYGIHIPRDYLRLGSQQVRIRRVRDARGCSRNYDLGGPAVQIQLYDAPSIYPLETRQDYCVGERIAYTLSGTPPFDVTYDFNGRWNAKSQTTNFRRVAEKPGEFTITSISDKASECRAAVNLPKTIHPMPSVQISQGRQSRVDIHEGGEVDIHFEFWGTPPFEFTYTRSSNAKRGQKSVVLETRHDISNDNHKVVKASKEGTYEVVAIKDKFCSFSTQQIEKKDGR